MLTEHLLDKTVTLRLVRGLCPRVAPTWQFRVGKW